MVVSRLLLILLLALSKSALADAVLVRCEGEYAGSEQGYPPAYEKNWRATALIDRQSGSIKWIVDNSSLQNGTFKIFNTNPNYIEAYCVDGCWEYKYFRRLVISPDYSRISDFWQSTRASQFMTFNCQRQ